MQILHAFTRRAILKFPLLIFLFFVQTSFAQSPRDLAARAAHVTIIRDHYGIPHVYGERDADAVFGLMYAQCEDDFNRVEMNYIEKLGRLAEVNGEASVYSDLYLKMLIDTADAKRDYKNAAPWLKELLIAFADGINYYLLKHPEVKPLLIKKFEPWFPLLWTDGSIGAISTGGLDENNVKNFYSGNAEHLTKNTDLTADKSTGSNGFAISGSKTVSGNAMLYINPHVSFYFRPEVQAVSGQGLHAYGAVTWGQFFIYQGFNKYCGWMHTSSDADVADVYSETIVKKNGAIFYLYENKLRPVTQKRITIKYKSATGIKEKTFTAFSTHHGPVMGMSKDKWLAVKSYNRSMTSLIQSWRRTKATGFEDYKKIMDLKANTSNNTVFADYKGNIAYWHGNFMPVRNASYNWSKPVDGSVAATEWKGLHKVEETVHIYNPQNGRIQNCNSTPFTAAGAFSPKATDYPRYMAPDGENFRGINAVRVLKDKEKFTLDTLIAAGYDTYLASFAVLIPSLIESFDRHATDTAYSFLKPSVDILRTWDYRVAENSVATALAVAWGEKLLPLLTATSDEFEFEFSDQVTRSKRFAEKGTDAQKLSAFVQAVNMHIKRYGKADVAWGEINRFQRISPAISQPFSDAAESIPVAFASSSWGMLPSYSSRYVNGSNKRYGYNGNSFICAVEFGKTVKAKSLLAGGESGDPSSKHFKDQALMYTKGIFKDVLFYREDVERNAEETYHPGERK